MTWRRGAALAGLVLTATLLPSAGAKAGSLDTLTISPPGDITVAATGPCGSTYCASVSFSFTASGGVPPYRFVCNFNSGDQFTVGSHTVSCIAQDSVGNSTPSASFTVTVTGGGPPPPPPPPPPPLAISPPGDISVAATGPCGSTYCAQVSFSFTASGGVPPYSFVCNFYSGDQFTVGSHTVSCIAQDSVGDSTPSASFTVTVTGGAAPPPSPPPPSPLAISPPGDLSVAATGPCGSTYCAQVSFSFSASGGVPPYRFVCNFYSGDQFTMGSHTVSCIAQDSVGNSTPSASFTVTVTAPGSGGGGTGGSTGGSGSSNGGSSGSTGGSSSGGGSSGSAGGSSGGGSGGSTSSARDTSAPTIAAHANITLPATSPSGGIGLYRIGVTDPDNAATQLTVSCLPASGSIFRLSPSGATKTTIVTCRAHDQAGNVAVPRSFTVTVIGGGGQILAMERDVTAAGVLTKYQRQPLLSRLIDADRRLASGATAAAESELRAFVGQVRRLSPILGQEGMTWIRASMRIARVIS